jgi:hypothetical protein
MTLQSLDIQYFTRVQAAKFLNERGFPVTETTLATKNSRGGGPRYFKFGKYALYTGADLLEWATAGMGVSSSTATELRSKSEGAE